MLPISVPFERKKLVRSLPLPLQVFILLTMFIAIISESFSHVQQRLHDDVARRNRARQSRQALDKWILSAPDWKALVREDGGLPPGVESDWGVLKLVVLP